MQNFVRIILAVAFVALGIAVYQYRYTLTASFQQDGTLEQLIVNILSYGVPILLGVVGLSILIGDKSR